MFQAKVAGIVRAEHTPRIPSRTWLPCEPESNLPCALRQTRRFKSII
jgi:hypothetical protein